MSISIDTRNVTMDDMERFILDISSLHEVLTRPYDGKFRWSENSDELTPWHIFGPCPKFTIKSIGSVYGKSEDWWRERGGNKNADEYTKRVLTELNEANMYQLELYAQNGTDLRRGCVSSNNCFGNASMEITYRAQCLVRYIKAMKAMAEVARRLSVIRLKDVENTLEDPRLKKSYVKTMRSKMKQGESLFEGFDPDNLNLPSWAADEATRNFNYKEYQNSSYPSKKAPVRRFPTSCLDKMDMSLSWHPTTYSFFTWLLVAAGGLHPTEYRKVINESGIERRDFLPNECNYVSIEPLFSVHHIKAEEFDRDWLDSSGEFRSFPLEEDIIHTLFRFKEWGYTYEKAIGFFEPGHGLISHLYYREKISRFDNLPAVKDAYLKDYVMKLFRIVFGKSKRKQKAKS